MSESDVAVDEVFDDIPSGYSFTDEFWATRYQQGNRTIFNIELSLLELTAYLREPNPEEPEHGNRRITPAHAQGFAKYIRSHADWASPALLLRVPEDVLSFDSKAKTQGGAEFGRLSVPKNARDELKILDGQHRVLGVHWALRGITADMEKTRGLIAAARRSSDPAVVRQHELTLKRLRADRDRLSTERVAVQVIVEDDPDKYRQIFADIADNAKGMSGSVRARFDTRKVVNRALALGILDHPLLNGHVDYDFDRITSRNARYLLSYKSVADLVHTVEVGAGGRISRRQEEELVDQEVAERSTAFLNVLVESFDDLRDVAVGELSPADLRPRSLLGSAPMLRTLAGAYHDLAFPEDEGVKAWTPVALVSFFRKLSSHMEAPVKEGSPWLTSPSDLLPLGAMAPRTANRGALKELSAMVVGWARNEPDWLRDGTPAS